MLYFLFALQRNNNNVNKNKLRVHRKKIEKRGMRERANEKKAKRRTRRKSRKNTTNIFRLISFLFFIQISTHFSIFFVVVVQWGFGLDEIADVIDIILFLNLNMNRCAMISPMWRNTSCRIWQCLPFETILRQLDSLSNVSYTGMRDKISFLLYESGQTLERRTNERSSI